MKTPEELDALKNEVEVLNEKRRELCDDELKTVSGGDWNYVDIDIILTPNNHG